MRSSILTYATRAAVATACVLASGVLASPASARSDREFRLRDDCDPVTFNAAIGPGACIGNGHTTLDAFNAELARRHSADEWKFNPDNTELKSDDRILLVNRGGEAHTFTRVARFGGGFVAALNQASNNPVPAPECATVRPDGTLVPQPFGPNNQILAAQTTAPGPAVGSGTALYQCCIHPWMRVRVAVRA